MSRKLAKLSPSSLRFGATTLFILSCAPVPEQPEEGGRGGATGTTGGSFSLGGQSFGGATVFGGSTFGGTSTTSGGSTGLGGNTSLGGTTTTLGGATGTTGGTVTATGGSGGATTTMGGATTTGGATTASGGATSASCDPLKVAAATPVVYDGANTGTCGNSAKSPYTGYWYTFNDASTGATQTPAKGTDGSFAGAAPGKGGGTDCGFHTTGMGFAKWGGGVGIDFHNYMSKSCPLDATAFTGIQFSLKGTSTGTQGAMYAMADNMLRVNLTTSTDFKGDDFGGWCPLTPDWTVCKIDFATAARVNYETTITGTFDKTKLIKIQFQTSKLMAATAVTFDFWVDDISFY